MILERALPSNPHPTSGVACGGHFRFMEAAMTYIHYGSDHFDPTLFIPVRNGGLEYGF